MTSPRMKRTVGTAGVFGVLLGAALVVDVEQIGVTLTVGVVDLAHHGLRRAVARLHPQDRERVEHVAQHARIGQHQHPVGRRQVGAMPGQERGNVATDTASGRPAVQVVGSA